MQNFFLSILSLLIFACSIMIIANRNPIHSIFFLILVFVCTTGLLLLLGVEFVAMLFLVVYVGAVTVLFLFVVMMLNVKIIEMNERFIKYLPIGAFIGLLFISEIFFLLSKNLNPINISIVDTDTINIILNNYLLQYNDYFNINTLTNIEQISSALYGKYVYLFLLGGMILLIAMIGAIVLTLNQTHKNKRQDYYLQTNRTILDSLKYLK